MRKTMFITRPTRDALTSHRKLIEAMQELEGIVWTGNRRAHQELERLLVEKQIKAPGVSNDGSGGRTWAALARTFGYWYPNANDKVVMTPVAKAITAGVSEHLHVQKQILNYQIPNGYVLTQGFRPKYDSGYSIFPFRFMLKLLTLPKLEHYLHRDEISLFFLTAKKDTEIDKTAANILHYRKLQKEDGLALSERLEFLNNTAKKYDHRRRKDSEGTDFLSYLRDSALTHMIIMESVNYYWFERSDGLIELKREFVNDASILVKQFETRYPFSTRYKISEESFARHYGLDLSRSKNTFRHGQGVATRKQKQDNLLKETAEEVLRKSPLIDNDSLVSEVQSRFPLDEDTIIQSLRHMGLFQSQPMEQLESTFIDSFLESAVNSEHWLEFENQSLRLLNTLVSEAFRPEKHSVYDNASIEIGVRLSASDRDFGGIVDCKSGQQFQLGTRERDLMATSYIPMYNELRCPSGQTIPLRFFGYIVGKSFRGKRNFNMIMGKSKAFLGTLEAIDGFVINAQSLLTVADLFLEGLITSEDLLRLFTSNQVFLDPLQVRRYLEKSTN